MEHGKSRYMVEVMGLSPKTSWEEVYQFFLNCGCIEHLEITRLTADISRAHVVFSEAYSVKLALFLSGSEISGKTITISSCGTCYINPSPYLIEFDETEIGSNTSVTHADKFASTPGEAVTVVQQVVQTMISKGYVLSKDALVKAKAFDESHQVSSTAAAKVAEFSKRIGLTDKINSGMDAVKSVDEKYNVSTTTMSVASFTGKTAAAAATAVVNSSYFAKGALWVSGVLERASKAAADLGTREPQKQ